jgi:hypothetical protein
MPSLIEHLEAHLGPITGGCSLRDRVQGVRFADCPRPGSATFMTLGLTHHVFRQASGKGVRLEFVISCRDEFVASFNPLSLLADIADRCLPAHTAPARGTVFGPAGRFFPESAMEALYCTVPAYFPDALGEFDGLAEPFVPIWLVPIARSEATYVRSHGWSAFEARLEAAAPDLLDLRRAALLLPV